MFLPQNAGRWAWLLCYACVTPLQCTEVPSQRIFRLMFLILQLVIACNSFRPFFLLFFFWGGGKYLYKWKALSGISKRDDNLERHSTNKSEHFLLNSVCPSLTIIIHSSCLLHRHITYPPWWPTHEPDS